MRKGQGGRDDQVAAQQIHAHHRLVRVGARQIEGGAGLGGVTGGRDLQEADLPPEINGRAGGGVGPEDRPAGGQDEEAVGDADGHAGQQHAEGDVQPHITDINRCAGAARGRQTGQVAPLFQGVAEIEPRGLRSRVHGLHQAVGQALECGRVLHLALDRVEAAQLHQPAEHVLRRSEAQIDGVLIRVRIGRGVGISDFKIRCAGCAEGGRDPTGGVETYGRGGRAAGHRVAVQRPRDHGGGIERVRLAVDGLTAAIRGQSPRRVAALRAADDRRVPLLLGEINHRLHEFDQVAHALLQEGELEVLGGLAAEEGCGELPEAGQHLVGGDVGEVAQLTQARCDDRVEAARPQAGIGDGQHGIGRTGDQARIQAENRIHRVPGGRIAKLAGHQVNERGVRPFVRGDDAISIGVIEGGIHPHAQPDRAGDRGGREAKLRVERRDRGGSGHGRAQSRLAQQIERGCGIGGVELKGQRATQGEVGLHAAPRKAHAAAAIGQRDGDGAAGGHVEAGVV